VNVAVHTAEQSFLGAPSTPRAEHNEVITAALELVDDLRPGISGALNLMDDDVFRDIGCSCRENLRRPLIELGSHRFAVETGQGDVTRDRRRDGDQSQFRVPGPREFDCVLESTPGRERAVDTDEEVEEQGLGQLAQRSATSSVERTPIGLTDPGSTTIRCVALLSTINLAAWSSVSPGETMTTGVAAAEPAVADSTSPREAEWTNVDV
jgi:hypothetical protein